MESLKRLVQVAWWEAKLVILECVSHFTLRVNFRGGSRGVRKESNEDEYGAKRLLYECASG